MQLPLRSPRTFAKALLAEMWQNLRPEALAKRSSATLPLAFRPTLIAMPAVPPWLAALAVAGLAPWLVRGLQVALERRVRLRTLQTLARASATASREGGHPRAPPTARQEHDIAPEGREEGGV